MKKYLVLSTLIHGALLLPLLWAGTSQMAPTQATSTLRFEILAFQEGDELQPLLQQQKALSPQPAAPVHKKKAKREASYPSEHDSVPDPKKLNAQAQQVTDSQLESTHNSSNDALLESSTQASQHKLDYAQQLKLYIEQNKFYPRSARKLKQAGLVRLQVEIDKDGNFSNIQIIEASHHEKLNQAALSLIKKLGHFKPLPKEFSNETDFTIPIAYQLSGGSR